MQNVFTHLLRKILWEVQIIGFDIMLSSALFVDMSTMTYN